MRTTPEYKICKIENCKFEGHKDFFRGLICKKCAKEDKNKKERERDKTNDNKICSVCKLKDKKIFFTGKKCTNCYDKYQESKKNKIKICQDCGIKFERIKRNYVKCLECHRIKTNKYANESYKIKQSKIIKKNNNIKICKNENCKFEGNKEFFNGKLCKECHKIYKKEIRKKYKKEIKEYNIKYRKKNKEKEKKYTKEYNEKNKDIIKIRKNIYRSKEKNKIKEKEYAKERRKLEKVKNQQKASRDKRRELNKNNPYFKLRKAISTSIGDGLRKNKSNKNNESCIKYLNYTIRELKNHLEKQFDQWMSWDNWGIYNLKTWDDANPSTWVWNVDHIIPHSKLPYISMDDENFKKCWSLDNLRPYSAKQNIIDGNRRDINGCK